MGSHRLLAALRTAFASSLLLALSPGLHAASIGLTPSFPDLTTSSATLTYTYTAICENDLGGTGTCGGVASGGGSTASRTYDAARWDLTYGMLTLTKDGSQTLNPDGSGAIGVSNTAGLNYDLKVVVGFNGTGTALSGILATDPYSGDAVNTTALGAYGVTVNPSFQSGTIVTGTPTDATAYGYAYPFGYAGSGAAGTFEFVFNNVGGDFAAFGGVGGIIISTFNLSNSTGSWDTQGISFWKISHSGTANVDTFVPVPGAVWLLGSALAALATIRNRVVLRS